MIFKKNKPDTGKAFYCPNGIAILFLHVAFFLCLQTFGQTKEVKFSLSLKDSPIKAVFQHIEANSQFRVFFLQSLADKAKPVSLELKDGTLKQLLDAAFRGQFLKYRIEGTSVLVSAKDEIFRTSDEDSLVVIKGTVLSAKENTPLQGATVEVKSNNATVLSDVNGNFNITAISGSEVIVSYVGFVPQPFIVKSSRTLAIKLQERSNDLDEVVVMGYGTTTMRMNTGNISKVSSKEIENQPVSNPLAALIGRVPGLIITQTSGMSGSGFKVQIRGQNSLVQGSEPFFVIDGVPFTPGNSSLSQVTNAAGQLSPLNLLNPGDIESIEVLKDADATAIYGSRGANGVVLITTKKGKAGRSQFSGRVSYGISQAVNVIDMMNTSEYVKMRREAFANDGLIPDQTNAPDLTILDTTRYTDFKKLLTGSTANNMDVQTSLSGGTMQTKFYLGASYHRETTVMPTDLANSRGSVFFNLNHQSLDKRFSVKFSANYSSSANRLLISDLTGYINMPPHLRLYDSEGKLTWSESGVDYYSMALVDANPIALLQRTYRADFQYLNGNVNIAYSFFKGFSASVSVGSNMVLGDEKSMTPSTSIDPATGEKANSFFANRQQKSWIVEPQLNYSRQMGKGKVDLLLGSTFQERSQNGIQITATNYSNDALLGTVSGAGNVLSTNSYSQYKYNAFFGRFSYSLDNKYIANISGRRDGSSRFGYNNRFSNFGAIGLGWIFSSEEFISRHIPVMSFGKLRVSYGRTGNDQIGDYRFLDTWTASPNNYQGVNAINPTSLYNPDYAWEVNNKLEIGLELGFLQDRIFFSASYFKNRSNNQLVNYTLPSQTGFTSVIQNIDATIQNKGLEFSLTGKSVQSRNVSLITTFNLSILRNKLVGFPGLETSSYASRYVVGEPVSILKVYNYQGLDPLTGLYVFEDVEKNGVFDQKDMNKTVNTQPKYFGGLLNTLSIKRFQVSLFLEFRKQRGSNYRSGNGFILPPGYWYYNQTRIALNRWQQPGDVSEIQKYSAVYDATTINGTNMATSTGAYSDASYMRVKSFGLSYEFKQKNSLSPSFRCFLNAQNLFTITGFKGADPENQTFYALPPLRTVVGGVEIKF